MREIKFRAWNKKEKKMYFTGHEYALKIYMDSWRIWPARSIDAIHRPQG
jgi:hypothetical protein